MKIDPYTIADDTSF